MYKKQMLFQTLGDEFRKFGNGNSGNPRTLCAISGIREFVPEKRLYRIRSAQQVPPGISGKSGHFRTFFRKCHKFKKSAKKQKTQKCKSVPKTSEILGVLSKTVICRSIEKVSKMTPKSRYSVHTFFSKFRGAFSGFSDFQLRIG
jgi:hypothetical protein